MIITTMLQEKETQMLVKTYHIYIQPWLKRRWFEPTDPTENKASVTQVIYCQCTPAKK